MRVLWCLVFAGVAAFGQDARVSLNEGVAQFKQQHYAEAAAAFRSAVSADAANVTARLYLATALEMQFVPGVETVANLQFANDARAEFLRALDLEPGNKLALASLASLAFNLKEFDESRDWNKKVIAVDRDNKEAYYTLGVLAWTEWLPVDRQARMDSGQKYDDPGPIGNAAIRNGLRAKWIPILDEGIRDMETALKIDSKYDDAMAYMNLLVRYRADLLDTTEEAKQESARADEWMRKAFATKKEKADLGTTTAMTPPADAAAGVRGDGTRSIRIDGSAAQANLVTKVAPVYPSLARQARVTGIVKLNVIIADDGNAEAVSLRSGHPLLVQAAVDAVKQWLWKPTLLNGKPVKVMTVVDVTFTLSE